eukprot:140889-Rhodomonas_salina.1
MTQKKKGGKANKGRQGKRGGKKRRKKGRKKNLVKPEVDDALLARAVRVAILEHVRQRLVQKRSHVTRRQYRTPWSGTLREYQARSTVSTIWEYRARRRGMARGGPG